tara:strand:- start:547 stop:3084 length:2538 start_codon:yes stop_codon:yes gene_type:complete
MSRAYHNTTSRYNGYFNAREIMREKDELLRTSKIDDYTQLLPIFIYPDEQQSQSFYPDMDKIIDKCSEVIERHSIYKRRTEHVKWIDDSYFLIGKARFYKEEFQLAEETFLYVYQAYKKNPARYIGLNWLIKTFIETKQYDKAEEFLDLGLAEKNKFPEEYKGHFNAIFADYYLKVDKDEEKAIEKLEEAVRLTKENEAKRRYLFILAQLYENQQNRSLAIDRYSRVLKLKPDYAMRFNAKINRAVLYDVTSTEGKDIEKELYKMLKDKRNENFRDQIYFALAEIAIKEDDEPKAIDYLKKSTKASVNNNRQKGLSYLKLANIYFEQPHYINAQMNYDSTLQFLPKDYPGYWDADSKNNNLKELVENLRLIDREDSLIALSKLSEKELDKKIKGIIKEIKAEEERKKQAEMKKLAELQNQNNPSGLINLGAAPRKGEWYFYNASNMAMGQSEFQGIWGNRPLEDDWRRKKKGSQNNNNSQETGGDEGGLVEKKPEQAKEDSLAEATKYDPETYMKDIPKDLQEELEAHGRIAEALFNVGTIFKESFKDYKSAIRAFDRIITQYDTSVHNLPSHYQLYRIYKLINEEEKAEIEKNWVLENHPFSEFAYLIKNPEYNKQNKDSKEKIEEFYAATFRLYQFKLYEDVINSCIKADETFSENHIQGKFDLLKAKSIGNTRSKEEFKSALQKVVKDHPDDPVKEKANQILAFMKEMGQEEVKPKKPVIEFDYNPKDKHILIISSEDQNSPVFKELRNKIADFNKAAFSESRLEVTNSALNDKSIYLIRTFESLEQANRYYNALKNNKELFREIQNANANSYLISNTNFRTLFKTKDETQYLEFYTLKYPT